MAGYKLFHMNILAQGLANDGFLPGVPNLSEALKENGGKTIDDYNTFLANIIGKINNPDNDINLENWKAAKEAAKKEQEAASAAARKVGKDQAPKSAIVVDTLVESAGKIAEAAIKAMKEFKAKGITDLNAYTKVKTNTSALLEEFNNIKEMGWPGFSDKDAGKALAKTEMYQILQVLFGVANAETTNNVAELFDITNPPGTRVNQRSSAS